MCDICDDEGCVNCDPNPDHICEDCGDPDCDGSCEKHRHNWTHEGSQQIIPNYNDEEEDDEVCIVCGEPGCPGYWVDPAGGRHACGDEEDPAKQYE